jgi:hypothetical protein
VNTPEQRIREMRVGMSLFWVRLVREGEGWKATWTQRDWPREVWTRGTATEAMVEARRVAREVEAKAHAQESRP